MKKFMTQGARWAMTVIKKAITWAAYQLLGMAILGIIVKTWPGLAILTGGGC